MTKRAVGLRNVFVTTDNAQRLSEAVAGLENDPEARERIVVGHGPAGRGKTSAGIWLAGKNPEQRVYLRGRQVWNTLKMLQDIGAALGKRDMPSVAGKAYDALSLQIVETGRTTLIIDEANYLKQHTLNILRDLHDEVDLTLCLLGEQRIVDELQKFRRLKSRVSAWEPFTALKEADGPLVAGKLLPETMGIDTAAAMALVKSAAGSFRDFVTALRTALRLASANDQARIDRTTLEALKIRALKAA